MKVMSRLNKAMLEANFHLWFGSCNEAKKRKPHSLLSHMVLNGKLPNHIHLHHHDEIGYKNEGFIPSLYCFSNLGFTPPITPKTLLGTNWHSCDYFLCWLLIHLMLVFCQIAIWWCNVNGQNLIPRN